MEKFIDINENIEEATNREVVKQNKISLAAIGFIVVGGLMAVWGMTYEDKNSPVSTALLTFAVVFLLTGVVKLCMGRNCYMFRPSGSKMKSVTLFFDAKESRALQHCVEAKQFDDLKRLKRDINAGVKLEAMVAGDGKFAAVQVQEYVPYTYEAICPVVCYYGDDAQSFTSFIKNAR